MLQGLQKGYQEDAYRRQIMMEKEMQNFNKRKIEMNTLPNIFNDAGTIRQNEMFTPTNYQRPPRFYNPNEEQQILSQRNNIPPGFFSR